MKTESKNTIGKRLRLFRKSLEINGYDFAHLIGISQGSLSDIENCNSDPSASTITKIATKTNCDIYWLLTGTTDKKKRVSLK